jgi:hypothetical protein
MRGPYKDNQYAVTFDGHGPDRPHYLPLLSTDYDVAKSEAQEIARDEGRDPAKIRIFYRVQVTAYTEWAEVGDDTDYQQVIAAIYRDFQP